MENPFLKPHAFLFPHRKFVRCNIKTKNLRVKQRSTEKLEMELTFKMRKIPTQRKEGKIRCTLKKLAMLCGSLCGVDASIDESNGCCVALVRAATMHRRTPFDIPVLVSSVPQNHDIHLFSPVSLFALSIIQKIDISLETVRNASQTRELHAVREHQPEMKAKTIK